MTEQQIQRVLGEVPLPPHEDWCCAKGCTGPGMCIAGGCGGSEDDCRCVVSEIREDRTKVAEALCDDLSHSEGRSSELSVSGTETLTAAEVPDISARVRELAEAWEGAAGPSERERVMTDQETPMSASEPVAAEKCGDYPPAMSGPVRMTIGADYHRCRLPQGHGGMHVNNDGETWRNKALTALNAAPEGEGQ